MYKSIIHILYINNLYIHRWLTFYDFAHHFFFRKLTKATLLDDYVIPHKNETTKNDTKSKKERNCG